jgi:hypothetical protein
MNETKIILNNRSNYKESLKFMIKYYYKNTYNYNYIYLEK